MLPHLYCNCCLTSLGSSWQCYRVSELTHGHVGAAPGERPPRHGPGELGFPADFPRNCWWAAPASPAGPPGNLSACALPQWWPPLLIRWPSRLYGDEVSAIMMQLMFLEVASVACRHSLAVHLFAAVGRFVHTSWKCADLLCRTWQSDKKHSTTNIPCSSLGMGAFISISLMSHHGKIAWLSQDSSSLPY